MKGAVAATSAFDVSNPHFHEDEMGRITMKDGTEIPNARLAVSPGGSHGICTTEKDHVHAHLLEFLKA